MSMITVQRDFLLGLLEEVGRSRALASHETDVLQDLVTKAPVNFEWTEEMCDQLLEAAARGDGVRRFARRNGITDSAAYQKLFRLRRKTRKLYQRPAKA